MKKHHTLYLLPILALASLPIMLGEADSLHPVLSGPDRAYLNTRGVFWCSTPGLSSKVKYRLIRDRRFLVGTKISLKGDQIATFPFKVKAASDGSYQCKATAGESTGFSNRIKLSVVTPPSNTRVTFEPSPPVVYEGSRIRLSCDAEQGSHLNYTWYFNRKEITSSNSGFSIAGNKLVMEKVTLEQEGNYNCIVWSVVQDTSRYSTSAEITLTVKVKISKPEISISVFKDGDNYLGNVTCWSSTGSPPVNFSLLLDDKEVRSITVTDSLAAWFDVPVVIGLNMGEAQCQGRTQVQDLKSDTLTLDIVPVGGDVRVEVDYLYTAEAKLTAAKLSCHISRGTFPHFSWLLNDSILLSESQDNFQPQTDLSHRKQALILSKLSPENSGYYRCRARDSYEISGPWADSAAVLIQITERFTEVIMIVFCCFFLLMLAAASACVYKMFDHSQANTISFHLSEPESQSAGLQSGTLSSDVQNLTVEMTV